jgi:hypothetical protein
MTSRLFPPPWQVEQIPGGYKVLDANGQALVYVYARETSNEANIAGVLTFDEARRVAVTSAARSNRSWDGCYPFVLRVAKEPSPSPIPAR